jgi:Xaa-Pro aminopeptidase
MSQMARLAALRARLVTEHLDALLITSLPNVRYLTNFSGSNAIALVAADDTVLLTDFRYRTQAELESGQLARVRIETVSLWDGVWATLKEWERVTVIGFESPHLTHRDFQRVVERAEGRHWRPTTDLCEQLRARKDPGEIALIRAAGEAAFAALRRTLDEVRVGDTELEICGKLERALRDMGSTAHPFAPIVAAGERAALPHARASARSIALGDFLLLDFGAAVEGYCCDVTRTVLIGKATTRQREVYEVVRQAQAAAFDGLRAGLTGREADALARGVIEGAGLGESFGHGLGHGIGLEVHEAPRLSRLAEDPLPEGAVVTVEPGVYLPDWGGVRIEDDVVLRAGGIGLLTEFPRDLLELGL